MLITAYRRISKDCDAVYAGEFEPMPDGRFRVQRIRRMPEGHPVPGPGSPYFWQIEMLRGRQGRCVVAIVIGPRLLEHDEPDWSQAALGAVSNPAPAETYGGRDNLWQ